MGQPRFGQETGKQPYTVLVQGTPYDDEARIGPVSYSARVMATDSEDAMKKARREAWLSQPPCDRGRLRDWKALVCYRGWPALEWV